MNSGPKDSIYNLFQLNVKPALRPDVPPVTNISLNPWWVTGFTDGDGSFSASIKKKPNDNVAFQPSLTVTQHKRDKLLALSGDGLWPIEQFVTFLVMVKFMIRKINQVIIITFNISPERFSARALISSTQKLNKSIIKHFDSYPLQSTKNEVYIKWRELIKLLTLPASESRNSNAINLINLIHKLNSND
jgi:hypothetical protein